MNSNFVGFPFLLQEQKPTLLLLVLAKWAHTVALQVGDDNLQLEFQSSTDKWEWLQVNPLNFKERRKYLAYVGWSFKSEGNTADLDKSLPYLGTRFSITFWVWLRAPEARASSQNSKMQHREIPERPITHSALLHVNSGFNIPAQLQ